MKRITTPVLLIGFNRYDYICQSFAAIRQVQPHKLYIAVDGARVGKMKDEEEIEKVKSIVDKVDWECKVRCLFSEKNLGCKGNITTAISEVFKEDDRVIVVEDDIVAPPSFFYFMEYTLDKYKDNVEIASVTGNNYTPISVQEDYFFSRNAGHIWGWGTWKRAWEHFNVDLPELMNVFSNHFRDIKIDSFWDKVDFISYCYDIKRCQDAKKDNFWGPQWYIYRRINNYLNIVPSKNLASNIGSISSRDSGNNSVEGEFYWASHPEFTVNKEPETIAVNTRYDKYHIEHHMIPKSLRGKIAFRFYQLAKMILAYLKIFL